MTVTNLYENKEIYSSNVYLVQGSWKGLHDTNTLIDTGRDPAVLQAIQNQPKGLGKKHIEQVILTHNHYDHASLLSDVIKAYHPRVYAFSASLPAITHPLHGGEQLIIGDRQGEIIYAPGHSSDSILIYIAEEKTLFCGDNKVLMECREECLPFEYLEALEYVHKKGFHTLYPGHGPAIEQISSEQVKQSLFCIRQNLGWNKKEIPLGIH